MTTYDNEMERHAAQEEEWRQAAWDYDWLFMLDEPPTRTTLNTIVLMAESECWYAIHDWNAVHPDQPFVVDCDDLRAACHAGIAAGIVTIRKVEVMEVV